MFLGKREKKIPVKKEKGKKEFTAEDLREKGGKSNSGPTKKKKNSRYAGEKKEGDECCPEKA